MDRFIILSLLFVAAFMLSLGCLQLIGRWRQRALQQIDQPKKSVVQPIRMRPIRLLRDRRLSESRRVHEVLAELPATWSLQRLITQSGVQFMTDRLLVIMALLFISGLLFGGLVSLNLIASIALGLSWSP